MSQPLRQRLSQLNKDRDCTACGMLCGPLEFHPYAACLMFRACRNSETVRANLAFVVEYGKNLAQQRKQQEQPESETE